MVSVSSCIAFLVLLCVVPALSINFNATYNYDCSIAPGCSFFNASIWEGGNFPTVNDDVNITGNYSESFPIIYIDASVNATFKSLYLEYAQLIDNNSTVSVSGSVVISTLGDLIINPNSSLTTPVFSQSSNSTFWSNGTVSAQNATLLGRVSIYSTFQVNELVFGSLNYVIPAGFSGVNTISVLPFVTLTTAVAVSNFNVAANSTVILTSATISNQLTVAASGNVEFQGLAVIGSNTATAPLAGNGTVTVSAATSIASASESTPFAGTVSVGATILTLFNVTLNSVVTVDTSVIIVQGVTFSGTTTVFGLLSVIPGGLTASNLILVGNVTVSNATLAITSTLFVPNPWSLQLESSTLSLDGVVTGNLSIPVSSTLQITGGNATLFGHFENHGILAASGDHYLNVFGDVVLHHESEIQASLTGEKDSVLFVHGGNLRINGGQLSYNMLKKPFLKSITYIIAETFNGTINGTFANETAPALSGSEIDRNLDIGISANQIDVHYKWRIGDTQWWAWVVLGIAVALIVVIIIVIVVRVRARRADYQPVR